MSNINFLDEDALEKNGTAKQKLSAREFLIKYSIYLPLFALTTAISLFGAYLYLRYAVPIYEVSSKLLIKSEGNKNAGTTGDLEGMLLFQKSVNLDNEIEILRSQSMMERVVKSLGLQVSYFGKGNIRTIDIYDAPPFVFVPIAIKDSSLFFTLNIKMKNDQSFTFIELPNAKESYSFGEVIELQWGTFKLVLNKGGYFDPNVEYIVKCQPAEDVASTIIGDLKIKAVTPTSSILQISLTTPNYKKGKDILTRLVQEYEAINVEDKNKIVDNTIRFLSDRLAFISQGLDSVEKGLKNFRIQNQVLDIDLQSGQYLEQFQETSKELSAQEVRWNILLLLDDYMRNQEKKYELVPSNLIVEDVTLTSLLGEYNRLQLKRERDLRTMPPTNPIIIEEENQLENLRVSIVENINNIKKSFQLTLNQLRQKAGSFQSQIRSIPGKSLELLEISRQRGIKEKIFEFLLQKKEEAEISKASTISNSRLVDSAKGSTNPIKPNRSNIYRIALLLGILLPIFIIYLKEQLNDKVTTRKNITSVTQAPLVGEIGHSENAKMVIVHSKSRDVVAEQFRIVRTNLQFLLSKLEKPVIMITSSMSGEGKSFISANIASVFAIAGKKTVVLEFDLRKPKIANNLGIKKQIGITNYIVGHVRLDELAMPVEGINNLHVIPSGPIPPNPAELLLDERIEELFAYLKEKFDVIILDTAPVGLVSDAVVLSAYSNCTLYVIRQRYTLKKQINMVNDLYKQNKLPKMGLIVNDVDAGPEYGYYGYGSYGYGNYGYGLGGYYEDDKSRKGFYNKIKKVVGIK